MWEVEKMKKDAEEPEVGHHRQIAAGLPSLKSKHYANQKLFLERKGGAAAEAISPFAIRKRKLFRVHLFQLLASRHVLRLWCDK